MPVTPWFPGRSAPSGRGDRGRPVDRGHEGRAVGDARPGVDVAVAEVTPAEPGCVADQELCCGFYWWKALIPSLRYSLCIQPAGMAGVAAVRVGDDLLGRLADGVNMVLRAGVSRAARPGRARAAGGQVSLVWSRSARGDRQGQSCTASGD